MGACRSPVVAPNDGPAGKRQPLAAFDFADLRAKRRLPLLWVVSPMAPGSARKPTQGRSPAAAPLFLKPPTRSRRPGAPQALTGLHAISHRDGQRGVARGSSRISATMRAGAN